MAAQQRGVALQLRRVVDCRIGVAQPRFDPGAGAGEFERADTRRRRLVSVRQTRQQRHVAAGGHGVELAEQLLQRCLVGREDARQHAVPAVRVERGLQLCQGCRIERHGFDSEA